MEPIHCHLWSETPEREEVPKLFDAVQTYEEGDHERRSLVKCRRCSQLYFYAFDEEVDWQHGNDAQFRTWIPVASPEEAEKLSLESRFGFLKYSPRLEYAWPSDAEVPSITWIGKHA